MYSKIVLFLINVYLGNWVDIRTDMSTKSEKIIENVCLWI